MNNTPGWQIPDSVLQNIDRMPLDRPVALLLRHSIRDHIPSGETGYDMPITKIGQKIAFQLGSIIGPKLRSLYSSPLPRCVQTADALRYGAEAKCPTQPDRLLGDPGIFVLDGRKAWNNWVQRGNHGVAMHLASSNEPLPGMARPDEAARFLAHHMLSSAGDKPGIHVFVSHDMLLFTTAARLSGKPLGVDYWPQFLEGVFLHKTASGIRIYYRDHDVELNRKPLCSLKEGDVIEFARREIACTVGLDSGASFSLAGGAFKTLLTGKAPRDLDLWASSPIDRDRMIASLHRRHACRLPDKPFSDAFKILNRVVEVPHSVEPSSLNERLGRFDIALSAVGVEHGADGLWSAIIHPLAVRSMESQEVLLLKPLLNWKYALTTLERLRRYGAELNFKVPADEEFEIWSVFDSQSPEMRVGMMERYFRTGLGGFNVAEEAIDRHPHLKFLNRNK